MMIRRRLIGFPGCVLGFVMLTLVLFASPAEADCRGCCSHHGGVVCKDGVTQCKDGTPLSAKCKAKGCDKCGGGVYVPPNCRETAASMRR